MALQLERVICFRCFMRRDARNSPLYAYAAAPATTAMPPALARTAMTRHMARHKFISLGSLLLRTGPRRIISPSDSFDGGNRPKGRGPHQDDLVSLAISAVSQPDAKRHVDVARDAGQQMPACYCQSPVSPQHPRNTTRTTTHVPRGARPRAVRVPFATA